MPSRAPLGHADRQISGHGDRDDTLLWEEPDGWLAAPGQTGDETGANLVVVVCACVCVSRRVCVSAAAAAAPNGEVRRVSGRPDRRAAAAVGQTGAQTGGRQTLATHCVGRARWRAAALLARAQSAKIYLQPALRAPDAPPQRQTDARTRAPQARS